MNARNDLQNLSLEELRALWSNAWKMKPHPRIGRKMLERSLRYKLDGQYTSSLTPEHFKRLNKLIAACKRNPAFFEQGHATLKPGIKLIRNWQGQSHSVTITRDGFLYNDQIYSSLSKIANEITGSNWNGWVFFGVKKKKEAV